MAENADWLLLEDAIRTCSVPQLWAEYHAAVVRWQSIPPQPSWIGAEPKAWRSWQAAYQGQRGRISKEVTSAERALHKEFKQRLRSGELVASGIREPVTPKSAPESIAASLWDVLGLDVAENRAHTKGLT